MSSISSLSFSPLAVDVTCPASSPAPAPPDRFWVFFCSCSWGTATAPVRSVCGILPLVRLRPEHLHERRRVLGALEQLFDVLPRAPQRLPRGYPLQGLGPDVEDHRVPRGRRDRVGEPRDAPASEGRPRG